MLNISNLLLGSIPNMLYWVMVWCIGWHSYEVDSFQESTCFEFFTYCFTSAEVYWSPNPAHPIRSIPSCRYNWESGRALALTLAHLNEKRRPQKMRKQFTAQQKASVALAALAGDKTINQVASERDVHPTQVRKWKDIAKSGIPQLFSDKRSKDMAGATTQAQIDELHRVIGVRDAELEWLKKKTSGLSS